LSPGMFSNARQTPRQVLNSPRQSRHALGVAAECRRAVDQLTCRGGHRLQDGNRSIYPGELGRQPSCPRTHQEPVSPRKRHTTVLGLFSTLGWRGGRE
jgi:hypothetical protein